MNLEQSINRFVVMCVEQYASFKNWSGKDTYQKLLSKGIINELEQDYDDLHGMSAIYLNDFIDKMIQ